MKIDESLPKDRRRKRTKSFYKTISSVGKLEISSSGESDQLLVKGIIKWMSKYMLDSNFENWSKVSISLYNTFCPGEKSNVSATT